MDEDDYGKFRIERVNPLNLFWFVRRISRLSSGVSRRVHVFCVYDAGPTANQHCFNFLCLLAYSSVYPIMPEDTEPIMWCYVDHVTWCQSYRIGCRHLTFRRLPGNQSNPRTMTTQRLWIKPWRLPLLYSFYQTKSPFFNMAVIQSDLDPKARKISITF